MFVFNTMPPTIGLSITNANIGKGHNSDSIVFLFRISFLIYSSSPVSSPSFKALVQINCEISSSQAFIMSHMLTMHESKRGHNSGIISSTEKKDKKREREREKKNTGPSLFHM